MTVPVDRVLSKLDGVRPTGTNQWEATCPAHEDNNPSLGISTGDDGRVLLRCHAGCPIEAIVARAGVTMADLFPEKASTNGNGSHGPTVVNRYPYVDEAGEVLFEVERLEPKGFRQRRPDGRGGWVYKLGDVRRVLYRLPEVLAAVATEEVVFVAEGEKDVHALGAQGLVATTIPGGTGGGWRDDYSDALAGADVVVVADADDPGRRHAEKVRQALEGVAGTVVVVEPAEGHKDAADHFGAGYGVTDFVPVEPVRGDVTSQPEVDVNPEAASDLFRTWSMSDLLAEDLTWEWMVKGMFSRPTYGQIAGEMKTFKSYLLTFIILGIASGRPIFDRFVVDHPGPVVAYVGEGGRIPWTRRILRCAEAMGLTADELADLPLFPTFDVAPVSSLRFDESLERDLDHHRPVLFAMDPFYAYHGAEVKS